MSDIIDTIINENQAAIRATQFCQQLKEVQNLKTQLPAAITRLKTQIATDQTKADLGANYEAVAAEVNVL